MCGIFGLFNSDIDSKNRIQLLSLRQKLIENSQKLRHRGPDWSGYNIVTFDNGKTHGIAHERLSIVDPNSGAQPLKSIKQKMEKGYLEIENDEVILAVNGEIYNYKELYTELEKSGYKYVPSTESDCEVIIPLYRVYGLEETCRMLRGMFAFIILDKKNCIYGIARDHLGIIPLYIGYDYDGLTYVASEMKALDHCSSFSQFLPGHSLVFKDIEVFTKWYNPPWDQANFVAKNTCDFEVLRSKFVSTVEKHMRSDVPWGVLLSGGLDSSLVASIAQKIISKYHYENKQDQWMSKIHSFSIGLEDSPDLKAAQKAADYIGTIHHSYTFTIQEGIDAIKEVIYHLETYDVTTIRASTPMFLMSRKIKAMGIKMVLSGEGADEMFGGYLYFHKAPNENEMFKELKDKMKQLYMFDCLRANKSTMAWGVEARVPFLDQDFVDYVMSIDPCEKLIHVDKRDENDKPLIEKYILRKAFDKEYPYLPPDILWRQKEQFSDGVGYSWIDSLKEYAEYHISDKQLSLAKRRFVYNTPQTKEAYYYREIFDSLFPSLSATNTIPSGRSIACSTERALQWDQSFQERADQSGRSVAGVHKSAY